MIYIIQLFTFTLLNLAPDWKQYIQVEKKYIPMSAGLVLGR